MRSLFFILLVSLAALLFLIVREYVLLPDGKLHLYMLDVGQGDAILLVSPSGKQIVIDGGPNTDLLPHLGRLLPFFDRTIDLLVLSHPDADHVTALPDVLRRYTVDRMLLSGAVQHSGRYEALLFLLASTKTPVMISNPDDDIDVGDGLILDVLWPPPTVFGMEQGEPNDASVVLRAIIGNTKILFTGDVGEDAERAILASGADIRADILKVPHHGSRTSSSTGFLLAIDPQIALISAGRGNQFGHPHQDVVARYEQLGIPVQSTQQKGTISLVID
jgi:competence protein ComEC